MPREDLKTLGAVQAVLGLMDVALGSVLLQLPTFFRKEIVIVFISGVWTTLTGFSLLCGGRKPSYSCVKVNVIFHLLTLMFSAVAFGTMVRHVPYVESRYCPGAAQPDLCYYGSHETMVAVGCILIILITILLVQALVSLAVLLAGLCSMLSDYPQQPEDPERIGSTTSEPLCLQPQQQGAAAQNLKADGGLSSHLRLLT